MQHHPWNTCFIQSGFPPRFGIFARTHTFHVPAETIVEDDSSGRFSLDCTCELGKHRIWDRHDAGLVRFCGALVEGAVHFNDVPKYIDSLLIKVDVTHPEPD